MQKVKNDHRTSWSSNGAKTGMMMISRAKVNPRKFPSMTAVLRISIITITNITPIP